VFVKNPDTHISMTSIKEDQLGIGNGDTVSKRLSLDVVIE